MVWDDPIFRKLLDSYLSDVRSNLARQAQTERQKIETEFARSGMSSSGVGIITRRLAYAGPMLVDSVLQSLESFDKACFDLDIEPDEADCDSLREFLEPLLTTRGRSVISSLRTGAADRDAAGLRLEETVGQLEGRARSELLRGIERRKLMSRNRARQAIPAMRERIAEVISAINRHGSRGLGFSIFQITEPKALLDLGRSPSVESDLTQSIQALGILLSQLNQAALTEGLESSGKTVPEGGINRLEAFLQAQYGFAPKNALSMLRDLARLRNGYPAHPLRPEVEDAARRLGISLAEPEPIKTWTIVMERLREALAELAVFLETSSHTKPKATSE